MSDVDQVVIAPADEVEWARRAARAEVARLSLAVRTAQRDTALRELAAVEACALASAAEARLAQSLHELVEERRRERERDLAVATAAAEQAAADTRERAEFHTVPPRPTVQLDDSGVVSVDELRELVQAAVAAGLAEAREQAVATLRLVPAAAAQPVPGAQRVAGPQRASRRVSDEGDEPPFWRRLVHADVLLPLIAALIVTVVFAAWMG